MTANAPASTPFPVRGTPGGWRDWWDDPDDSAALRAIAEDAERQLEERVARERSRWKAQIKRERTIVARSLAS